LHRAISVIRRRWQSSLLTDRIAALRHFIIWKSLVAQFLRRGSDIDPLSEQTKPCSCVAKVGSGRVVPPLLPFQESMQVGKDYREVLYGED
jgi:hypothetical protein